ncbi:MAG: hypothetical protein Q9213_004396 [Squamulea squamosa]
MATEIATIPLQPGIDIDDLNSAGGKVLSDTFDTLRAQEGYQRAYHGRQVETPNVWQLLVDWDSVDAHKKFINQPYYEAFGKHLMSIVDGDIQSMVHAHFSPHPPSAAVSGTTAPVTEMITHYFSTSISKSEQSSFESDLKKFARILEEKAKGCTGFAGGWVVEELEHEGVEGKTKSWQSCVGWQSIEAHMAFRGTKDFEDNVYLMRPDFKKATTMHHTKFTEAQNLQYSIVYDEEMGDDAYQNLEKEYCPPIDSALFYAIISDYDLFDEASIEEARRTLDILKDGVATEDDGFFDPSGSSRPPDVRETSSSQDSAERAQSWHGDILSENTDSTSISHGLQSLSIATNTGYALSSGTGEEGATIIDKTEALSVEEKIAILHEMFPTTKIFDVSYHLKKQGFDFGKAVEELLNQAFMESENGEGEEKILRKGVDAFTEPATRGRKEKGKRKRQERRTSSTPAPSDIQCPQSSATSSRWDRAKEDVDFLTQRTYINKSTIRSIYHASGASLPSSIAALCSAPSLDSNPHLGSLDSDTFAAHVAELALDFPALSHGTVKALIQLTHPSTASAHELARAALTSPISQTGSLMPQYALRPPSPPAKSTQFSQSKPRPLAMAMDTATSNARASAAARSSAFAQASAAYRKSKSKPLMGGAASYYSSVGRDASESLRRYEAAAADAQVDSRSRAGEIDLHGVTVKDAVRISQERVETWWEAEGQEWARSGKAMGGRSLRIVTGVGRHSEGSKGKLGPAVLASFVDPRQAFGPDKVIPPQILANAKGLAVLTIFKAGFLGTARFGSGIVVARLADGTWSAPSALATGGGGFGGQIGFELTDFVFILNNAAAVRTFSQQGSVTLGTNVSIAAGPVGRNAEAAGAASLKGVAAVFAYSKTKGLFAGVSLEGSVLIERRDANEKLYNSRITAKQLLAGGVRPPPSAEPLMRVLNSRVFAGVASQQTDAMYNDIPIYDESHDNVVWEGRTGSGLNEGVRTNRTGSVVDNDYEYRDKPQRASTWTDDVYDRPPAGGTAPNRTLSTRANPNETFDTMGSGRRSIIGDDYSFSDSKPSRPTAPKPKFTPKPTVSQLQKDQAVALYTFDADQPGDLGFKKGEIITITKRTENPTDWWTGRIGDRTGVFPSNYVDTT